MKRIFAFLLTMSLLCSTLPATITSVYAAETEEFAVEPQQTEVQVPVDRDSVTPPNNTCGENLTWTLDSDGTLTISGTGPMTDFADKKQSPWFEQRQTIRFIEIEEGVTTIGAHAFENCSTDLRGVSIPSSVTSIGDYAFKNSSLTSVTFPEGLETIGEQAFFGTWIEKLTLPASLRSCGVSAFSTCSDLINVDIKGLTVLPDRMLAYCSKLQYVTIPSNVTSIGNSFSCCSNLKSVIFLGTAPTISDYAFDEVTATISYPATDPDWESFAFDDYAGTLTWFPVGDGFFVEGTYGQPSRFHWRLENHTLYISGDGQMFFDDVYPPWHNYCGAIKKVVMSGNTTRLDDLAFADCVLLTDVTFNEGLRSVMGRAFYNCISLEQITFPNSVQYMDSSVFWDCDNLKSVTLSANLQEVPNSLFYGCASLEIVTIPANVKKLSGSIFAYCTSLKAVYFTGDMPNMILQKGHYAPASTFLYCNTTLYYPARNKTWTTAKIQNVLDFYQDPAEKGSVTFVSYSGIPAPKVTSGNDPQSGLPLLKWTAVEDAGGYDIYRNTSKTGTYTWIANTKDTQWVDTAAIGGTTCYYKVKAMCQEDPAYSSDYSAVVSAICKCAAPEITVKSSDSGKPYITWEKVSGAKKYTVYRATSENGKYSKLGTTTKTTYTDTKAKAGTTYFYKVIANASSSKYNSGYSNIASCGVICGTPTVSVTVDTTTGKPSLSWKKVDGATQYAIYRKLPTDTEFVLLAKQTAVSYKDTTAPVDTKCEYYVQALGKTENLNGAVSKVVTATSGIAKPTVTGNLNDLGQPKLSWKKVEGAVKYEVYRSTKSSKGYVLIQTVEGLSYEDTTATIGKTYYYKVKAIGAVSKSADSSYVKLAGKCATPELFIETDDSGRPYLKWYKVDGAKKYTVYRATSQNGKYKKIGTTTKIEYIDTKAAPGSVYYYKIVANASSSKYNSGYSNIVSCPVYCATPTVTVTNNSAGAPVISWKKVTGAVKYKVMYMDATDYLGSAFGPYADFEEHHTAVYTTKTSFTIPNTEVGRFYMVVVVAVAKNESYSSEGSEAVFADAVPATPKVTGKVGANKKPVLSWKAAEGAVTYKIYRSTSKSKGYELLDETEDLSYEDLTALKGKTYYYKVVAVRYGLSSAESTPVKVKSK